MNSVHMFASLYPHTLAYFSAEGDSCYLLAFCNLVLSDNRTIIVLFIPESFTPSISSSEHRLHNMHIKGMGRQHVAYVQR